MSEATFVSRYDRRVRFVQDTLRQNSKLGDKASFDLAVKVVYALDHIPEPTR